MLCWWVYFSSFSSDTLHDLFYGLPGENFDADTSAGAAILNRPFAKKILGGTGMPFSSCFYGRHGFVSNILFSNTEDPIG